MREKATGESRDRHARRRNRRGARHPRTGAGRAPPWPAPHLPIAAAGLV